MTLNLADLFFQQADANPDHPVILGEDTCITYGDLHRNIRHLTERLQTAGVVKGMNIGLHVPSGTDYIAMTYALWACGVSVTPIPAELADEEKRGILKHISIDQVISPAGTGGVFQPFVISETTRLTDLATLYPVTPQCDPPAALAGLNPAFIRFTSGTTGKAKGVVLSHETISERIHAANQGLCIGPEDRIVWLLSMAYHFAVSIVAYLSFGATMIFPKNAFGVSILQAANHHDATMIYGAPPHYELMTHDRSGLTLPRLRLAIATTTRLKPELADTFFRRFGLPLNETYGIIEIGLPAMNLHQPREKQGSVGRPLAAYDIRLKTHPDKDRDQDQDQGQDQDQDQGQAAGEIQLNGPGLLDAYYTPWQPRADILAQNNGWLATGDLGVMDEDGFLTIVGRSKEMISVAGMKFFPQEVEAILERHPAIRSACVFGISAHRTGEAAMAHLVGADDEPHPTETELKAYCNRHLAGYKIPVDFQWVSAITRTASGKRIRNADTLKLITPSP
ncbi:MAG: acyl--CoA ligase [Desulfobacterales bacterium]|nr:acyl--CoA ligase [Desulfobacterales bacterium]